MTIFFFYDWLKLFKLFKDVNIVAAAAANER